MYIYLHININIYIEKSRYICGNRICTCKYRRSSPPNATEIAKDPPRPRTAQVLPQGASERAL